MVTLGWMQDSHINADTAYSGDGSGGSYPELYEDFNRLDSTYSVDDIYFTGDLVAPDPQGQVPHGTEADFDEFWSLINKSDNPDLLRYTVPGNHDVPLGAFLDSDPRCVLRKRVDYPSDDVSVFLLNTQANSYATGGKGTPQSGSDYWGGAGVAQPRISYRDIKWLEREMNDAGNNTKILLPHAPLLNGGDYLTHSLADTGDGDQRSIFINSSSNIDTYEVVSNTNFVEETLQQFNDVYIFASHLNNTASNGGVFTTSGLSQIVKPHYWKFSESADPSTTAVGVIDVTSNNITVKLSYHDGSENKLLDQTV